MVVATNLSQAFPGGQIPRARGLKFGHLVIWITNNNNNNKVVCPNVFRWPFSGGQVATCPSRGVGQVTWVSFWVVQLMSVMAMKIWQVLVVACLWTLLSLLLVIKYCSVVGPEQVECVSLCYYICASARTIPPRAGTQPPT